MRNEITHDSKKLVLHGTTIKSPDVFIPEIRALRSHDEEIITELTNTNHGYTYKVTVYDVLTAETLQTGEIQVRYRDLEDKEKMHKITLPKELHITHMKEYN